MMKVATTETLGVIRQEAPSNSNLSAATVGSTTLDILKGQLDLLQVLERDIKGWRQWTDELEGHWEKHAARIRDEMHKVVAPISSAK